MSSGIVLTMSGTATAVDTTTGAYTGGSTVFPYTYNASNGQLTVNQNSTNTLINVTQGTALVTGGSYVFVLDNEAPNPNPTGAASRYWLTPSAAAARCRRRPTASFR